MMTFAIMYNPFSCVFYDERTAGRRYGGPSYNKHVPNIYFILVFGYACYRRCCGLVAAPYR